MKKRKISLLLVVGISLVLVSFFLIAAFQIRVHIGFRKSQDAVVKLEELLPEQSVGIPDLQSDFDMPVLQIAGVDYVALLEIPLLDLSLPVADRWDKNQLFDSPARFCGSAYDHTLVIGGADYPHQFSFCDKIENGTDVVLTDMTGARFAYKVARVDRAKNAEKTWLAGEGYDLTLYCRDMYSMEYVAVRCQYAYQ